MWRKNCGNSLLVHYAYGGGALTLTLKSERVLVRMQDEWEPNPVCFLWLRSKIYVFIWRKPPSTQKSLVAKSRSNWSYDSCKVTQGSNFDFDLIFSKPLLMYSSWQKDLKMYSFVYLWCIVFRVTIKRSKVSLFAIFSSTGVKFWKMIWFSWEAFQIVRLAIHIEKQNSFHYLGCHHIWEITHAGGNICRFHRFPWSSHYHVKEK